MKTPWLDDATPIAVLAPLRVLNQSLVELLAGFSLAEWHAPTIHPDRQVKDLVAHLLHGSLRRVTGWRDHYDAPAPRLTSHAALTAFIQEDNRRFMEGMKRVSPAILSELVATYDRQLVSLVESLDLNADGLGVVWAGE